MNMNKLSKTNEIEKEILLLEYQKQSIVDLFDINKIEDKNSSTYRIMKEIRNQKFIELDNKIDELMNEREKFKVDLKQ